MNDRQYYGDWDEWGDLAYSFSLRGLITEPRFIFATYTWGTYESAALVIYSDDGQKFHVIGGSTCFSFGLEDRWCPTEHSIEGIEKMFSTDECIPYGSDIGASNVLEWARYVARPVQN